MSIPIFRNESLIPSSIGSLSLEDIEIFPDPRLGVSIQYGNETIKVDSYLYNLGVSEIPDNLRSKDVWTCIHKLIWSS